MIPAWLIILAVFAILLFVYFGLWAICLSASIADDANENAAMRKVKEDEVDAKIGKAVRGELKWKRRMEDK